MNSMVRKMLTKKGSIKSAALCKTEPRGLDHFAKYSGIPRDAWSRHITEFLVELNRRLRKEGIKFWGEAIHRDTLVHAAWIRSDGQGKNARSVILEGDYLWQKVQESLK